MTDKPGLRERWRGIPGATKFFVVVLALPFIWLVTVNFALWTGFVASAITGERERSIIRVEHGFAWCVFPTRVHFTDLRVAIDTHTWQLDIEIPAGEADVSVASLLWRRFHAREIRARNAKVVYRYKVDSYDTQTAALDAERLEAFGPVSPGLPPAERKLSRPIPPAPSKAWDIELSDVAGTVETLWINEVHSELDGTFAGSLHVRSQYAFAVGPTWLDARRAEVWIGDRLAFDDIAARVDLDVASYAPQSHAEAVLRNLSMVVRGQAQVLDCVWIQPYVRTLGMTPIGGSGILDVQAALASGILIPGSRIRYLSDSLRIASAEIEWEGAVDVTASVSLRGAAVETTLAAGLTDMTGTSGDGAIPWIAADWAEAVVSFGSGDVAAERWAMVGGQLSLPWVEIRTLMPLTPQLGPIASLRGRIEGSAYATLSDGHGSAVVEGLTNDLGIKTASGAQIRGDGDFRIRGNFDRGLDRFAVRGLRARIHGLGIRTPTGNSDEIDLEIRSGTVVWRPGNDLELSVHGHLADVAPIFTHVGPPSAFAARFLGGDLFGPATIDIDALLRWPDFIRVVARLEGPEVGLTARYSRADDRSSFYVM